MSKLKDETKFCQMVLSMKGSPATYKGEYLSQRDRNVLNDAYSLWIAVVWSCVDVDCSTIGRLLSLLKEIKREDSFEVLQRLSQLDTQLLESVADPQLRVHSGLKSDCDKRSLPKYAVLLKSLTKTLRTAWRYESSTVAFKNLHQIYCFLSRVNLEHESLREVAEASWHAPEEAMKSYCSAFHFEKKLIQEWFPYEKEEVLYDGFNPHHSGGSTREGTRVIGEKPFLLSCPPAVRAFCTLIGWDPDFSGLMQSPYPGYMPNDTPPSYHRVIFVPKNWKTYRVVSKETVTQMFWQQGMASAIQSYLKSWQSPALSRIYCVDTEARNRELARLGSIDGSYATIDMSEASDRIPFELVYDWFSATPLSMALVALRSYYAEFAPQRGRPARIMEIEKFAPMGSALCFPIESIVFSAFDKASVLSSDKKTIKGNIPKEVAVYGDDQVVPFYAVEKLFTQLERAGMKVNRSKSFYETDSVDHFRESCGGEYLNGYDVTCKRIPRKFNGFFRQNYDTLSLDEKGEVVNGEELAQLIDLANECYDLRCARRMILYHLLSLKRLPILMDEDGSRGLRSSQASNLHLQWRWNASYQRWEALALRIRSKYAYELQREDVPDSRDAWLDEVRLFEYLRLAHFSSRKSCLFPEDRLTGSIDPYQRKHTVTLEWCGWCSGSGVRGLDVPCEGTPLVSSKP